MNTKFDYIRFVGVVLILAFAVAIALPSQTARAATITVTTTSDGTGGPGCTLRDAITAADTDTATGDCPAGAGPDTIVLASGATYTLTDGTLPAVHSQITIEGNGSIIERSSADGTPEFRIFYLSADGDLTLNELTISNGQTVAGGGGGIKNWGTLTLNHSTVSDNTGSGILTLEGSSVDMDNSTVSGNSGGGIINLRGSVVIDNSTISGNYDNTNGGGIHSYYGSLNIDNSNISGNSATSHGGGIYNRAGVLTLTNSTVDDNLASVGGGMYNLGSSPTLTNVILSGNSAYNAGGMVNDNSNPVLINVIFLDNSSIDYSGGGMSNWSSNPTLTNVTFLGNSAGGSGGGMYNYTSNPTLTNVTFSGNLAYLGGGMTNDISSPTLINVIFSSNSAYNTGGMRNENSNPTLTNVTFFGNHADNVGGGISNHYSNPTVVNTILWGNTADHGGHQINNSFSNPVIGYSLIQDSGGSAGWDTSLGTDGGGNIDADPLFVDPANDDLHLSYGSPAVDSGDLGACPPTDLDGVPRPQGAGCDMGAYELVIEQIEVDIDIKPGSDPSCFNNDGKGVIPVAVLGNADFDVDMIDPGTVLLEGLAVVTQGKSNKLLAAYEDINGDGYTDLVIKIEDVDGTFTPESETAELTGSLYDGTDIFGVGDICITQ